MRSELERICRALGIPYGRGKGIVFHDTRHSAITSLTEAGAPEAVGMTITRHKGPSVELLNSARTEAVAGITQPEGTTRNARRLPSLHGTDPKPLCAR